jgi:hypothetical protein
LFGLDLFVGGLSLSFRLGLLQVDQDPRQTAQIGGSPYTSNSDITVSMMIGSTHYEPPFFSTTGGK